MEKQRDFNLYNVIIRSKINFPELTRASGDRPNWFFNIPDSIQSISPSVEWLTHWAVEEDEPWLSIGRDEDKYLLSFPGLADFYVSFSLNEIWCHPNPNTPIHTTRHLFIDQVMPRIISQQGNLLIHGSAIIAGGRAIAFLGESGHGKSTIVGGFSLRGYPILADDCLHVKIKKGGVVYVGSSYPSIRLWPDSFSNFYFKNSDLTDVSHYSSKKRVIGENDQISFYSGYVPLDRIYLLCPLEKNNFGKQIIPPILSKRESFMEVIKSLFQLDITDRKLMIKSFEICSHIIDSTPVYSLCVPKDFSKFPDVLTAITEEINID